MQQRTFDGEGHRECEQPLPSALGSVISGLGGSNEAEFGVGYSPWRGFSHDIGRFFDPPHIHAT